MRRLNLAVLVCMLGGLLAACGTRVGTTNDGTAAPTNALVVRMLYGSEKQAWIEAVTAEFNSQRIKSASGKPIFVEAVAKGSADSLELIVSEQDKATIWSPASSILLPIADDRWGSMHNGAKFVDAAPPLVLSPVVIAMWRPMAEALGWPAKPIGWKEIGDLARNNTQWSDFGHPEWGPFQFGHTHPDYSNSGITTILATVYAATGKTRDLSVADVQKPETAQFLAAVEKGVIHYGESTGFFGRQMFNRGPAYLSAAVLYENLVVESNDRTKYPNRPLPVVAIYPREGTFWSDHPFVIPQAPWITDELRSAATTYRDFLLARPQQERALQFGFRPADPQIAVGAPINAENGVDASEPKTLLKVPNAEVIAATRALWSQNKKGVEVQIVLDVSGSMEKEGRLEQAKTALKRFVEQLGDNDVLGITVFGSDARELTPLDQLGPKRQQVLGQIDGLFPNGGTRLIDSVSEAYTKMQGQPAGERIRALVVLSDGADNESSGTEADLRTLLAADEEGRSIKVFTIAYGTGSDVDTDLMKTIAESSGAKTYISDPARIDQVYRDIATFF